MSGIVNAGQYCYFNSLMQCFSNNLSVRGTLRQHGEAMEEEESKWHFVTSCNTEVKFMVENSVKIISPTIRCKYSSVT